jgi:hypothetical protein
MNEMYSFNVEARRCIDGIYLKKSFLLFVLCNMRNEVEEERKKVEKDLFE